MKSLVLSTSFPLKADTPELEAAPIETQLHAISNLFLLSTRSGFTVFHHWNDAASDRRGDVHYLTKLFVPSIQDNCELIYPPASAVSSDPGLDLLMKKVPQVLGWNEHGLRLWDVFSGRILKHENELTGYGRHVNCFCYDKNYLVLGSDDRKVLVLDWNLKQVNSFYLPSIASSMSIWTPVSTGKFEKDPYFSSKLIICGIDGFIRVFDWHDATIGQMLAKVALVTTSPGVETFKIMLNSYANAVQLLAYSLDSAYVYLIPLPDSNDGKKTVETSSEYVLIGSFSWTELPAYDYIDRMYFHSSNVYIVVSKYGRWRVCFIHGKIIAQGFGVQQGVDPVSEMQWNVSYSKSGKEGWLLCETEGKIYFMKIASDVETSLEKSLTGPYFLKRKGLVTTTTPLLTAALVMQERFFVRGFETGDITVSPLVSLFENPTVTHSKHQLLRGHKAPITSLMSPQLGLDEGEDFLPLNWLLSGSSDGTVRLWDIHSSLSLRVFNAHAEPIIELFQPKPDVYHEFVSSMSAATTQIAASITRPGSAPGTRKLRNLSRMSSGSISNKLNTPSSSTQSLELHSPTHRLLQTLLRSFYASSDSGVTILDWEQGRVGWWLSGLADGDRVTRIIIWVPETEVYEEGVQLFLLGEESFAGWTLDRNGGVCDFEEAELGEFGARSPSDCKEVVVFEVPTIKHQLNRTTFLTEVIGDSSRSKPLELRMYMNFKRLFLLTDSLDTAKDIDEAREDPEKESKPKLLPYLDSPFASTSVDVFKALIGWLVCWGVKPDLDLELNRIGIQKKPFTGLKWMMSNLTNSFISQLVTAEYCRYFSISHEFSAHYVLILMLLFNKLGHIDKEAEPVCIRWIAFISSELYEELQSIYSPNLTPACSLFARFHFDSIGEIQTSSRVLLSSYLKSYTAKEIKQLISQWLKLLPYRNSNFRFISDVEETVRAATVLGTLAISATDGRDTHALCLTGNGTLEFTPPLQEDQVVRFVLGDALKKELLIGFSLFLSLNAVMGAKTSDDLASNLFWLVGIDFIGRGWALWEPLLMNMTVQDLKVVGKLDDNLVVSASLPLHLFLLRRLWAVGATSSRDKHLQLPDFLSFAETGSWRHPTTLSRRYSVVFDPSLLSKLPAEATQTAEEEWLKHQKGFKKKSSFRAVLPLNIHAEEDYRVAHESKSRQIINSCRQSVIMVCQSAPTLYVSLLCGELLNSGLRDGDWDRVRVLLRGGVSLIMKQRPISFFPVYLPKIVEAMVKGCLDPNIPFSIRERLSPAVTSVIHDMIRTYPTVTFHAATQRLAVATATEPGRRETAGQIIVWDLKTATRTQIIDAHVPRNVSAISFNKQLLKDKSPKREFEILLASYSIDDHCVKFWHLHSGFLSAISTSFQFIQKSTSNQSIASDSSSSSSESILGSLAAGAAGSFKMFRSFQVDPLLQMAPPLNYKSTANLSDQRRLSYASALNVLQEVRFHWQGEHSVILQRTEPLPSLTFNV